MVRTPPHNSPKLSVRLPAPFHGRRSQDRGRQDCVGRIFLPNEAQGQVYHKTNFFPALTACPYCCGLTRAKAHCPPFFILQVGVSRRGFRALSTDAPGKLVSDLT